MRVGSRIRHIKRGTEYDVISRFSAIRETEDNARAWLSLSCGGNITLTEHPSRLTDGLLLPVTVQIGPKAAREPFIQWLAYRSLDGAKKGEVYVRPCDEFSTDRFQLILPDHRPCL